MPLRQAPREAARKASCINHLRQIGVALHAYHNANHRFPPLYQYGGGTKSGTVDPRSPYAALLPYLGHSELHDRINFEGGPWDSNLRTDIVGRNETVKKTVLGLFICPSDGDRFDFRANSNYAFGTGDGGNGGSRYNGAFSIFRCLSVKDVGDGLSHTVGISEIVRGSGRTTKFIHGQDFLFDDQSQFHLKSDEILKACAAMNEDSLGYGFRGYSWFNGGFENTWFNHVAGPNAMTVDCAVEHNLVAAGTAMAGSFASRSAHSNGVHSALMDGSTKWFGSDTDIAVWRALGTRQGGEISHGE